MEGRYGNGGDLISKPEPLFLLILDDDRPDPEDCPVFQHPGRGASVGNEVTVKVFQEPQFHFPSAFEPIRELQYVKTSP